MDITISLNKAEVEALRHYYEWGNNLDEIEVATGVNLLDLLDAIASRAAQTPVDA